METGINRIMNVDRRQRMNRTYLGVTGLVVLFIGALAGSAATANGWLGGSSSENKVPIYVSSDPKVNEQVTINGGFSAIAKAVTPAVVTVIVESRTRQQQVIPFFFEPFRDFFDRPEQDEEGTPRRRQTPRNQQPPGRLRPSGLGSGVIVSPDGYIITNNHVVEDAEKVKVELADRRELQAKVIGKDPASDLAVIKIDSTALPTLPFGDSDKVEVGDLVLAVGNPLGIGKTVTMGIISAKGRQSPVFSGGYEDFLQTDAAINRGNSGGALVNLRGELVGIPSQIYSNQSGGNIGIGFAIPTKMARNVMDQLIRSGKVRRGKLGLFGDDITPELARNFGYKGVEGAVVTDVQKGDPADIAGIKSGDIITEFNGQRVTDYLQFRNLVSSTPPGTTVKIKLWRDGSEQVVTAKLGELDLAANTNDRPGNNAPNPTGGVLSGVRVENLTPELSRNLPDVRGVIVTDVDPDSTAAGTLRRGDVIESVNKQPVTNVNEFNAAIQKAEKKEVLLRYHRGGRSFFGVIAAQE
jgi:serine protease Do